MAAEKRKINRMEKRCAVERDTSGGETAGRNETFDSLAANRDFSEIN